MNEERLLAKIFGTEYKPTAKQLQMEEKSIQIKYCPTCDGFYVQCPRCGNNTCNAGYGKEEKSPNGKCPVCPQAYELYHNIKNHRELIESMLLNGKPTTIVEN